MVCDQCGGKSKVVDSRKNTDKRLNGSRYMGGVNELAKAEYPYTIRTSECKQCGHRFNSVELPAAQLAYILSKVAIIEKIKRLV